MSRVPGVPGPETRPVISPGTKPERRSTEAKSPEWKTVALTEPNAAKAEFSLAGKNVTLIIGFGAGGGYDLWGRLVARHIGKHLPGNPTVVPQNMPGAGSLNAANHLFNVAPRDGSAFGVTHRFVPIMPLLGMEGAQFDVRLVPVSLHIGVTQCQHVVGIHIGPLNSRARLLQQRQGFPSSPHPKQAHPLHLH